VIKEMLAFLVEGYKYSSAFFRTDFWRGVASTHTSTAFLFNNLFLLLNILDGA